MFMVPVSDKYFNAVHISLICIVKNVFSYCVSGKETHIIKTAVARYVPNFILKAKKDLSTF